MRRPTYREYREFGHGRWEAATLACPSWALLTAAACVGYAIAALSGSPSIMPWCP